MERARCANLMNWRVEESLPPFERSLAVLRNLKHPSARSTTMPQINMGFAYNYLGRYDEASQIFEVALKDRNEELGSDDYSCFV